MRILPPKLPITTKWPFPATRVVTFGSVAQVNDERVIEHGPVAFGNSLQFSHQPGDQFEMEPANGCRKLIPGLALVAAAVSDRMLTDLNTQTRETNAEIGVAATGGDGQDVGQPTDESGSANIEMSIQPVGFDIRFEFVVDHWCVFAQRTFDFVEPTLAMLHRLIGIEVRLQLFSFLTGKPAFQPFDIVDHEVEQIILGKKVLPGGSLSDAADKENYKQDPAGIVSAVSCLVPMPSSCR
ncbi:MAG: hypothetical protein KatS3mg105_0941 [Gemmatales bacterium]|nr:MAG: hypothetical protein KatS3mg105_0941 [Gemmatales bacterium]